MQRRLDRLTLMYQNQSLDSNVMFKNRHHPEGTPPQPQIRPLAATLVKRYTSIEMETPVEEWTYYMAVTVWLITKFSSAARFSTLGAIG